MDHSSAPQIGILKKKKKRKTLPSEISEAIKHSHMLKAQIRLVMRQVSWN